MRPLSVASVRPVAAPGRGRALPAASPPEGIVEPACARRRRPRVRGWGLETAVPGDLQIAGAIRAPAIVSHPRGDLGATIFRSRKRFTAPSRD